MNLDLEVMEKLHSSAPNLEEIEFMFVILADTRSTLPVVKAGNNPLTVRGKPFVQDTASKLKAILVELEEDQPYEYELSRDLAKLILYFGQKYLCIQKLDVAGI